MGCPSLHGPLQEYLQNKSIIRSSMGFYFHDDTMMDHVGAIMELSCMMRQW
jgi:hypothetical protein